MRTFDELYVQLNTAQKQAVDTIEGPVVVAAGPGTGKTQMLALRIANILRVVDVKPENILALTFTNAGVRAMRTRLASMIGAEIAYRIGVFTFHSFCEEQIAAHSEDFPLFFGAHVADDVVRAQIVEDILRKGDFARLKTFASDGHYVRDVLRAIDELKREGVSVAHFATLIAKQKEEILASDDSYYKRNGKGFAKGDLRKDALKDVEKNTELHTVYDAYQQELATRKLYDFADMIVSVVEKVEEDDVYRARLQEQFQYILVDEHQDTNDAQNRLLLALGSAEHLQERPNIFAVGDAKQSIYRFAGASVENFQSFHTHFRDVTTVDLTENYRSTQNILDAAHAVMQASADTQIAGVKLVAAARKDDGVIAVRELSTYDDELYDVVSDIARKIADGVDPREIAVFYRNNSHLADIAAMCEKLHVPYVVASTQNALTDQDVQQLLWFIRAVADPMDDHALGKVLLSPLSGIDTLDVLALFHRHARGRKKQSLATLARNTKILKEIGITKPAQFTHFMDTVAQLHTVGTIQPFDVFFETCVRDSGYLAHIVALPDHREKLDKLNRLFAQIKKGVQNAETYRISDFLSALDAMEKYGIALDIPWDQDSPGVRLMTAHAAKGLEFDYVYITNAVDNVWGKRRRMQKFHLPIAQATGDVEDERRLFYVAMTRARQALTITYARYSAQGKDQVPVRFLAEVGVDAEIANSAATRDISDQTMFALRYKDVQSVLSPEYIRARFFAQKLSASTLNNYFQSPLLYFFRNIVKLPHAESRAMTFGNVVHGALEDYFRLAASQQKLPSENELLALFTSRLDHTLMLHGEYEHFARRGTEALRAYFAQHSASFTPQARAEEWFGNGAITLDSGEEIGINGKIDRIDPVSDNLELFSGPTEVCVVDYKTGTPWSRKNKDERSRLMRQMTFYKLLIEQEGKYLMREAQLHFVEPNKDGICEVYAFAPTAEDVRNLMIEINQFAQDVLSDEFLTGDIPATRDTQDLLPLLEILRN
jgi:DNA helicase-2/ATP-dependent DNA helicase PcrA